MAPRNSVEWGSIPGWEGLYSVSDSGLVRSERRALVLTPMWTGGKRKQYATVALQRKGVREVRKVHHLVLEAFVGPRPDGQLARHLNDDVRNNSLGNLCWGTPSENSIDCVMNGGHKLTHEQRLEIKQRVVAGEKPVDLAVEFGINRHHVSSIKTGRIKTMNIGESL